MGPLTKEESSDPYEWVPSGHESKPEITIGEPALFNPCSYDSVRNVLKHLSKQVGIGENRQWSCVGCDGLPYILGSRLIDSNDDLKNILLIPGYGHLEMNIVKSCYKLLWDIALKDLAKMLGFRTQRALVCCQNCTDHHKAWMILKIFMYGTMDEILLTYVSSNDNENQSPSVAGLYNYISNSEDSNFRFMCDVVFNYLLAVFVFRCGVRRNNSKYITAGKSKFLKLFYGLNQTYYQEIMFRDLKTRLLAPDAVNVFLQRTESFSLSSNNSKGEGGDFLLESVNRRAKRWLPPGIPNKQHWIKVCRNLDLLEKIKSNTLHQIEIKENTPNMYQRDTSQEVLEWRCIIRKHGYLNNKRTKNEEHCSMSGEYADSDLICFESKCSENLTAYLDAIENGNAPGKGIKLTPVFMTQFHRGKFHDIERKTKQEIAAIVDQCIHKIHENGKTDEAFDLEQQWNNIRVKTKKDILMFYKEIVHPAFENATTEEIGEEESDDEQE